MGNGEWGMGNGDERDERRRKITMPNPQCPMPNAQCPMNKS
ncbi:Signal transduction histidine kinase [Nostoc flagelliforme CCNUN1]|uniref:Signal transduction histidine kinase n=1 Tax=Nostoc flagelliforme CCNUN1 TaxID=2038116 RepID=A0A2K8STU5_9NOSO|nr:Signal transduction histidine kinase [Nostoc flagelliforme CCNUN1]